MTGLMAAFEDTKRRFGVGLVGLVLYLVLLFGGGILTVAVGDPPVRTGVRRRLAVEFGVPTLVWALGLFGVVVGASNLPTYVTLARTGGADTGTAANADGDVVLRGAAETAGGTVETPFGGTAALAYTTRVLGNTEDDATEAAESEQHWTAVHVGEEVTTLAVDDGSGPTTVDPTGAQLYLEDCTEQLVPAHEDLPAHVRRYLDEAGVDPDDDAHLRFEERALEPGEDAFVLGAAGGGTVDADLLAEGDHEQRIRGRVKLGGGLGGAATVLGYLGMLFVSGVF